MSCTCDGAGSLEAPLIKRPGESRLYEVDFANLLATGGALGSISGVAQETVSGSGALTIGAQSFTGSRGQVRLSDGDDGALYKLTMTVTDGAGNTLQECFYVKVGACA